MEVRAMVIYAMVCILSSHLPLSHTLPLRIQSLPFQSTECKMLAWILYHNVCMCVGISWFAKQQAIISQVLSE